ncbi:hypothetical protein BsWGS_27792 [Bradybaena similaris]
MFLGSGSWDLVEIIKCASLSLREVSCCLNALDNSMSAPVDIISRHFLALDLLESYITKCLLMRRMLEKDELEVTKGTLELLEIGKFPLSLEPREQGLPVLPKLCRDAADRLENVITTTLHVRSSTVVTQDATKYMQAFDELREELVRVLEAHTVYRARHLREVITWRQRQLGAHACHQRHSTTEYSLG